MHINSMPDLVFRLIFSKIPLQDLLNAGRVCELWKWHQMEITKRVRSLTLIIGSSAHSLITYSLFTLKYRDLLLNDDGTRMYPSQYLHQFFHLIFARPFSAEYANQLVHIFPCITTLEIVIEYDHKKMIEELHTINLVITLLTKWSSLLKSLKMYFNLKFDYHYTNHLSPLLTAVNTKEGKSVNLLEVINSLSSLQHLTLYSSGYFFKEPFLPCHLTILGQLREFYLESQDYKSSIVESLEQYAVVNDNLKQLGLPKSPGGELHKFYQKYPQLQSKAVNLYSYLNQPFESPIQNSSILKYTSLTQLQIYPCVKENIFTGALNFLASLKELTHLDVYFYSSSYFSSLHSQNQHHVYRDQIAKLASIRVLILNTIQCDDYLKYIPNLESPNNLWSHVFPNVQVIDCLNLYYYVKADIQNLLATFAHCSKLRHLYIHEKKKLKKCHSKYL